MLSLASVACVIGCSGNDASSPPGTEASGGVLGLGGSDAGGASTGGKLGVGGSQSNVGGSIAANTGGSFAAGGQGQATGGAVAAGGTNGTGGLTSSTGGTKSIGGTAATGGTRSSGGSPATGGLQTAGGAATGGKSATGGAATGGLPATGGKTSTGGTNTTGGAAPTGGTKATGGAISTGGAATGGATGSTCQNSNADKTGAANINLSTEYQNISGFGGANIVGWTTDLTTAQTQTAFGTGDGQIGMSIIRLRIAPDQAQFAQNVTTAKLAASLGAKVMATPWTPPASMKSNSNTVGGTLNTASYGAYADHLLAFRTYMQNNGVPIYALSVQNEPDISVTYESCDFTGAQMLAFVKAQGSKFSSTKLMAAESFHFDHALTDPILNDATAASYVSIIAGHIYGAGLTDYPAARNAGKEVWMTEHYTESSNSGNAWPLALDVGTEIHKCMAANFSAYVWWYIRRSYGPLLEDGTVSKRGHIMAQYTRFIRPGSIRIAASAPSATNVNVTAYKNGSKVIVVVVNTNTSAQTINLNLRNGCVGSFSKYTTSGTKNVAKEASVALSANSASVSVDAQSVTTFVSE